MSDLRILKQYIPQLPVELIEAMTPTTELPPDAAVAEQVAYSNATSLLNATNVQSAVDEVENRVDVIEELIAGGLSGVISSVFGRTGTIIASSGDYTSSLITNTSGVSGITVADALNTLDSSKALANHVHGATAITFTADGDIAATNVQAAIVEVRNDTDTKLSAKANTSHSHAAGDVSFTPSGDITSITTQSAIVEVRDDTDTKLATKITSPGVTADGDILVRSLGAWARLPVGSNGQVLTVTTGAPAWAAPTGGTDDQTAAEVPFTPNGDIVATDVQAAIVEVRNDTDTKLSGKVDTSDPRLTDARTPVPHAASHVGGSDAIQLATSLQNGLMTSTYAGKLDGIEAGADVTDATNVAAAGALMSGATAGGQLGGTYPNPDVRGLRETSGPTQLTIGSISDGQFLVRSGTTLIGSTPGGSGDVVGPAGGVVEAELAAFDGATGKLLQGTSISTSSVSGHLASTSNPHSTTAAQVGAIPEPATPATGDLIYRTAGGAWARLAIGSTDNVLKVTGGVPAWGAASGGSWPFGAINYVRAPGSSVYSTATNLLGSTSLATLVCVAREVTTSWFTQTLFGNYDGTDGVSWGKNRWGDQSWQNVEIVNGQVGDNRHTPMAVGKWNIYVITYDGTANAGADAVSLFWMNGTRQRRYDTAIGGVLAGGVITMGGRPGGTETCSMIDFHAMAIESALLSDTQILTIIDSIKTNGVLPDITGTWQAAWIAPGTDPGATWAPTYGTGNLTRSGGAWTAGTDNTPVWG